MKKGTKNIHLHRETLRNLDEPNLKLAAGGLTTPLSGCLTGCCVPTIPGCVPTVPVRTCPM
jgi:hypothetical protein